jgi:hypothetical protein
VHFAANDLWGEGTEEVSLQHNRNGFLTLSRELREKKTLSPDVKKTFDFLTAENINSKFSSSDVISFVFSHDNEFGLSEAIQNDKRLYGLIFIHFSSILYFMAQFMQKLKLPIPENITFTGMGSLYIQLISDREEDIKNLSSLLLKKFTGLVVPNGFKVQFTKSPKEITAEGAVYGLGKTEIKENKCKHFGFKDDTDKDSTFAIEDIEPFGLKEKVLANLDDFLNILLKDKDIRNYLNSNFDLTFDGKEVGRIKDLASVSFDQMHFTFDDSQIEIPESMFFWTLKETLYRISSPE